ncbi:hypothetical protein F5883DRAFT_700018 [Diaporthe sp. PMI_573]|nr:hypothetical protein F5883DRAFT_700018 [Diaporthaceae sp. PMI_573]
MLEVEDVSMGTRLVVSSQIRPDFDLFSSPSHAQYDPAVRLLPDSLFAPPEDRDAIGPTPSIADLAIHGTLTKRRKVLVDFEMCTTAGSIVEYHYVNTTTTNKVDFVLVLEPSADPINPAAAVSEIDQLRSRRPCLSINHTAFEPVLRCPIAVSIETKRPGAGDEVATVQAGIWAAAHWTILQSFTAIDGKCQLPDHLFLPTLVVSVWSDFPIGDTRTVLGIYHQTVHRNIHKHACVTTKKAHTEFLKEETSLRNGPADGFMLSPPVFEEHAGGFWDVLGTRDYMRARLNFVDTVLSKFPRHRVAVQTALDHLMDVLRLNRSDSMGLRNMVPSLMLRLGRNQDAYGFVKW